MVLEQLDRADERPGRDDAREFALEGAAVRRGAKARWPVGVFLTETL
jgi:hypothetical protein